MIKHILEQSEAKSCKPDSVFDNHSSRRMVTQPLKRPTQAQTRGRTLTFFGLASDRVYSSSKLPLNEADS